MYTFKSTLSIPEATSKIRLSLALSTIREYAFERTRFPLILQLSVHCSLEWQKVAAKLITTHLENKLLIPNEEDVLNSNPSPSDFKGKILIMGKKLKEEDKDSGELTEDDDGVVTTLKRRGKRIQLARELSDLVAPFLQLQQVKYS